MITTALTTDPHGGGQPRIVMTLNDGSTWTLLTTQPVAQARRTMDTIARAHEGRCLPGIPLNLFLSIMAKTEFFEWEDCEIGIYVQSDRYAELKEVFGDAIPPQGVSDTVTG